MIRGEGRAAHYRHPWGSVHRFGMATADGDGLARAQDDLAQAGLDPADFTFGREIATRQHVLAIRGRAPAAVRAAERLIRWPDAPGTDWQKGYLAGIFDAHGSHRGGALRIISSDPRVLGLAATSLTSFG